jgi:hypothetical protein
MAGAEFWMRLALARLFDRADRVRSTVNNRLD